MKLILLDQMGCGAAFLAAAYLTGKVSKLPTRCELRQLHFFIIQRVFSRGSLTEIGTDTCMNRIYTLGAGTEAKLIIISAEELFRLAGGSLQDFLLIDMSNENSCLAKICYFAYSVPILRLFAQAMALRLAVRRFPKILARIKLELEASGLEYSFLL